MMTTHGADSRLPADLRPVRLVARRDLAVSRVRFRKARYWHIKDPLSLRYYQLRDEEYLILRLLNGRRSLRAIKQAVDARFAPRHLELPHLQAFLGRLHREGLTIAMADGQGAAMLRRARARRRENWLAVLANPLAIRFRGLRSSRLFDWLHARTAWMFQPWLGLAGLLLIVAAFSWLLVHADTARHRFPDLQTMLSGRNVVWLALALTVVKVVHELAHGLTCRHFGARCHETGVMLLVFVPCLYCNVSDAWTIPSKWQRVAISGAGIGAELTLASLCTFLWWFSEPGLLNAVCLNVLVVCSVGTLLLNGNPLLRYDGYYMLADLLEIPNLQQEAAAQVRRVARPLFMNDQAVGTEDAPGRRAVLLTIYGVASALYRWIVVAGVLWICLVFFRAEGVPIVGHALIIMVVAGLLVAPVIRGASFLLDPRSRRHVSRRRLAATAAIAAALALLFFFVPLPHRVSAPLVVEPANARPVYVVAPGTLDQLHVAVGSEVRAGQELAVFVDAELEQRVAELTGMRDHQRQHVANLTRQQMADAKARDSLPSAEQLL
ncbi:MAG: hypothetical protein FJ276_24995, partial [Planctomycetes bacterium]|nr:hypothetical protein [Planctomycetota bacterium]